MAVQLFKNNTTTTLNGGLTNVATSIVVVDGSVFGTVASPNYMMLTLFSGSPESKWEIVKVTNITGNTLTVERGQDGTTGVAWDSGDRIGSRLNAGSIYGFGGSPTFTAVTDSGLTAGRVTFAGAAGLLSDYAGFTYTGGTTTGGLAVPNTTASTTTTTGAFTVAGGVGVAGQVTAPNFTAIAATDAALGAEQITATADRDFSAATNWTGTNWIRPLLAVAQANDITVAASGKTFTRTTGSFITDGFQVGMSVTWSGFAKAGTVNNNTFVITTVTALVMTCSAATLSDEVPADYTACSAVSSVWSHAVAGANAATLAGYAATAAAIYQIVVTIVTKTVGTTSPLTISYGGTSAASVGRVAGTLTTYTVAMAAANTNGLVITPDAAWIGWIDDISVKLVTISAASLNLKNSAGTIGVEGRTHSATSLGMGVGALKCNTGANNTAFGSLSQNLCTSGSGNSSFGYLCMQYNTTGTNNVAMGVQAMTANTVGSNSCAFGYQALLNNISGNSNVAFGSGASRANTSASNNSSFGTEALYSATIGGSNVAFGLSSLRTLTTGTSNVAVGLQCMYTLLSGGTNTGVGMNCFYSNSTGGGNVGLGYFAGFYELGSNAFYVDNQNRTNTAGDKAGALLYGTFNATAASQTLAINAITSVAQDLTVMSGTAIPAGGTAGRGLKVSATANFGVFFGSGAPSLAAAKGSLYLRSDGTTTNDRMYVNTDGNTTWTAVTTAA